MRKIYCKVEFLNVTRLIYFTSLQAFNGFILAMIKVFANNEQDNFKWVASNQPLPNTVDGDYQLKA